MKYFFIVFIILICFQKSNAQNASIKGVITDTLNKHNLTNAVISLLHSKDSILYTFTRSDKNGNFNLSKINKGKYIVLVTYPTYADYFDTIHILNDNNINLETVKLTPKAHLLADVTVVSKIAAVRMKGDTIVYKADSFKVKQGATVEDLIKLFPGIQVDKNGNITAHGTRVEKVMVDGEEFFGDDPTIATKNLSADMVNEVQVFDKKSDQATFTGVDDGQTSRTINLKLKENAKKGWFGKLEASIAIKDVWNNSLMANSFKGKRKLSFYGIASSNGKTGLNWDESSKYGSQSNTSFSMSDDGSTMYFEGDDFDGMEYFGQGLPKSWSGGINYGNKFNNNEQQVNGSYLYSKVINEGTGYSKSKSLLPDTVFFNNENNKTTGVKDKHGINGTVDWQMDSLLSLKVTVSASKGNSYGNSNYYNEALNEQNQYVNNSIRNKINQGKNKNINYNVLVRKKFKKIGRTLSLSLEQKFNTQNNDGYLYSENNFYNANGSLNFSDTTDQKKLSDNNTNNLKSKIAFTEQLLKSLVVEFSYTYQLNNYTNKVLSYDKNNSGKYEDFNTKFSNNFKFTNATSLIGTMFRYQKNKLNVSFGGNVSLANFKQKDLIKDTTYHYQFNNIYPTAILTYKFNSNKRITINYNGNTKQPSINQLQPVADNNNPLFIQKGNPNLVQEFNHAFAVNYNNYQVLKNRGYGFRIRYNTTYNAIRSSIYTDSLGRSISQYVNLNGNNYFTTNINYNTKVKKLDIYVNASYSFNIGNSISIVNNQTNKNVNKSHQMYVGISKEKENKFNLWLYNSIAYNISSSSIRSEINTQYWSASLGADLSVYLPWKLELNNNIEAELRQKTELFSGNNNITIWNIYISRKIFKGDKSQLRFTAFDILNQRRNYERDISSNTITETGYQQLSQYFLFSFIWNFNKGGAAITK